MKKTVCAFVVLLCGIGLVLGQGESTGTSVGNSNPNGSTTTNGTASRRNLLFLLGALGGGSGGNGLFGNDSSLCYLLLTQLISQQGDSNSLLQYLPYLFGLNGTSPYLPGGGFPFPYPYGQGGEYPFPNPPGGHPLPYPFPYSPSLPFGGNNPFLTGSIGGIGYRVTPYSGSAASARLLLGSNPSLVQNPTTLLPLLATFCNGGSGTFTLLFYFIFFNQISGGGGGLGPAPPPPNRCTPRCHYNARCINCQCRCNRGYTGNGIYCTIRSPPCSYRCHQNARCVNSRCQCNPGYSGNGRFCFINTGYPGSEPCNPRCSSCETCMIQPYTIGIFGQRGRCVCRPGCVRIGYNCVPSAPCTYPCHQNARCVNSRCQCNPGYSGNGYFCFINTGSQCSPACVQNEACEYDSQTNSYNCACLPGHVLSNLGSCVPGSAHLSGKK